MYLHVTRPNYIYIWINYIMQNTYYKFYIIRSRSFGILERFINILFRIFELSSVSLDNNEEILK